LYVMCVWVLIFFFFQAEDGIRDDLVTGVQTCALPISVPRVRPWLASPADARGRPRRLGHQRRRMGRGRAAQPVHGELLLGVGRRSEERRVGKECRCLGATYE